MVEKLGKQDFHYDVEELFEPITKKLRATSQNLLEENRFNTKAIEDLDESKKFVKASESMNKTEVIHSSLIRTIAKHLVPKIKSQFRLLDDPDNDRWNDCGMNGEKVTRYDDKIYFADTVVVSILKSDNLSMISAYDCDRTDSPDAKQIINFLDEMHFDIHAKGKSSRDKNLIKNKFKKRAKPASGISAIFLSETSIELCDNLKL